ncbi:MAG TPA: tetratricopeptide repeat protein, partial [Myxococcales bacterium]|nr:tetratricopeptide repeat protein [Myxococcales bacterium]
MDKNKVIESATKLIVKGQLDKAAKEYQRVLDVDPDDVRTLQKLAELYQKMRKQSEAADCFEKVARTYAAQGFYLKAVALYKQVLKVVERVEVNVRLAELYQQLGLIGDATKEWQTVAAQHDKTGDHKASLDALKKLVDLDPDNVASRIRLGEQYARQDNPVEAVAELRRAAQYLQRNGRTDDYLRVAERISHLDQSDTSLARELAEHFLSRGDSKRALSKLQICFKANPRDLNTLQMLAKAFQDLGQTSKTVSVLKELARVHNDAGRADEARKAYAQAAELAPDDPEVKSALRSGGESPRAAPAPAPAPSSARPSPAPQPRAAAIVPPAAPAARSAPLAPPPPPSRAAAAPVNSASIPKLLKETDVYVKYGLHDKATGHLRKILAADPNNVEAHEKAKEVALATGRSDDAVAELATLVRLYTQRSDPRAQQARTQLRELDPRNAALAGAPRGPELEIELEPAEAEIELE